MLSIWWSIDSHTWHHKKCHVCPCSKEWAHCMERTMVCPYVKSFITNRSLHDSWRLGFCCHCGGYWLDTKTVALGVISWPTNVVAKLSVIAKIHKYRRLYEGHHFIWWPWRCMVNSGMIWIVSSRSVFAFSKIDNQEIIYICLFTFNFLSNMLVLLVNML